MQLIFHICTVNGRLIVHNKCKVHNFQIDPVLSFIPRDEIKVSSYLVYLLCNYYMGDGTPVHVAPLISF